MKLRRRKRKGTSPARLYRGELAPVPVETAEEAHERQTRIDTDKARADALKARRDKARQRREDINEFCSFVGRDAITNKSFIQEQLHEDFQLIADTWPRAIIMAHPESGKTSQIGMLRVLWLLGNNPGLRIAVVSKTKPNATKTTRAIKEYIEKSEELAEVFPELIPGEKWAEDAFIVRRATYSRDPSIQAVGLDGTIIGSRVDVFIFDDILDLENTMTPAERKKALKRIKSKFLDRLTGGGRALFLTNAWHPEDPAHALEKEGKEGGPWKCFRFSVLDEDGAPSWPDVWSLERIDEVRAELGPIDFARAMLCKARDEGESPFDEDAIERAVQRANDLEVDLVYACRVADLPPMAAIYTGVDLAVSQGPGAHLTALVTILLWPEDLSRQILWVESGRWSSREIRNRILDHDKRYGSTFIVENVAAQKWIIDIVYNQADLEAEERRLPAIVPFRTGRNKAHPQFGVEGLAVEIDADKWVIPTTGPDAAVREVLELRGDMLYYTRGAHTGDRLMGAWFAREGCRRGCFAGRPEAEGHGKHEEAGGDIGSSSGGGVRVFG